MILNKRLEFQQPTSILFVDFKAAFDSINRGTLWQILEQYGFPSKLISMLKAVYDNTRCTIRIKWKNSADFTVDTGVRQELLHLQSSLTLKCIRQLLAVQTVD